MVSIRNRRSHGVPTLESAGGARLSELINFEVMITGSQGYDRQRVKRGDRKVAALISARI